MPTFSFPAAELPVVSHTTDIANITTFFPGGYKMERMGGWEMGWMGGWEARVGSVVWSGTNDIGMAFVVVLRERVRG